MNHFKDAVTCMTGTMMIDSINVQPNCFKSIFWKWSAPLDAPEQISAGGSMGQTFRSGDTYEQAFLIRAGEYK